MTFQEISTMVGSIGLPYAFYEFPDGTDLTPPFVCFLYGYNDIYADNANYKKRVTLYVELYTSDKDFTQEAAVESVLSSNGLTYGKESTYIDSEKMWQTVYSMEVLINEQ